MDAQHLPQSIYLDFNATTPVAPEVLEVMIPALRSSWGNPSSSYALGREARALVEESREEVAALIGCERAEVVFTGGGTESDNAALIGVAEALGTRCRRIVVSAIEHPAVGETARYLASRGWEVAEVAVGRDGRIDLAQLERALEPGAALVSVIHAHNETGVIQPIEEASRLAHRRGILVHTDAAQSVGKIPVNVDALGIDLLTIAGHKLYAPKGVGALFIRRGTPFAGLLRGGGQEGGRRAGTENVASIVGLGAASALARLELPRREKHLQTLRDRLIQRLRERLPDLVVHAQEAPRLPNTLFAALPGKEAAKILARTSGVAFSAGSACHADRAEPASVLEIMGVPGPLARATLRLSTGRTTTSAEIDEAASRIADAADAM